MVFSYLEALHLLVTLSLCLARRANKTDKSGLVQRYTTGGQEVMSPIFSCASVFVRITTTLLESLNVLDHILLVTTLFLSR